MDIYKALKKESKTNKRFYIFMGILSVILPLSLWLTGIKELFLIIYLLVIEILILLAVLKKIDFYKVKYSYSNNKLRIKSGIFSKENLLLCDKIAIVHTEKMEEDMDIIIVSTVKIRNRGAKPIVKGFLKKYPEVSEEYLKMKSSNPDTSYYFQIIRKGGLKKYMLLDEIYKYCVKATYTDSCVQNIKIARGQTL